MCVCVCVCVCVRERERERERERDVGQNLLFNFCNLLILVFLSNFYYFRFRAFTSFFWGAFNVV